MTSTTDERSLRDRLLESADDLEHVVKMIVDSLVNREKSAMLRSGESVTNIIKLFDLKQDAVRKLLQKVPEYQERENLIRVLQSHVEKRDEKIKEVEENLKACECAITRACFHANEKLKKMKEAELRPVNSEMLIKLSHQISKHNSISAPLTWQIGDPSRPFPQEHEFRAGQLLNSKTQSNGPQPIQGKNLAQRPLITSPSASSSNSAPIRTVGTPLINSAPPVDYSPRTGFGNEQTPPIQKQVLRGATPNEKQWQNAANNSSGTANPQSPFVGISQSPSSSPNVKLKITGLQNRPSAVDQVQEVRDVEQMSSDDSNSSDSSDDERPAKKAAGNPKT